MSVQSFSLAIKSLAPVALVLLLAADDSRAQSHPFAYSRKICAKHGIKDSSLNYNLSDSHVRKTCGKMSYKVQAVSDLNQMPQLHKRAQAVLLNKAVNQVARLVVNGRMLGANPQVDMQDMLSKFNRCGLGVKNNFMDFAKETVAQAKSVPLNETTNLQYQRKLSAALVEIHIVYEQEKNVKKSRARNKKQVLRRLSARKNELRNLYPQLLPYMAWSGSGSNRVTQNLVAAMYEDRSYRRAEKYFPQLAKLGYSKQSEFVEEMILTQKYPVPPEKPAKDSKEELYGKISMAKEIPAETKSYLQKKNQKVMDQAIESIERICKVDKCGTSPKECEKGLCKLAGLSPPAYQEFIANEPERANKDAYERLTCSFCGQDDLSTWANVKDDARVLAEAGLGLATVGTCFMTPLIGPIPCVGMFGAVTTYVAGKAVVTAKQTVDAAGAYFQTKDLVAAGLLESSEIDAAGKRFMGKAVKTLLLAAGGAAGAVSLSRARYLLRAANSLRARGVPEKEILRMFRTSGGQQQLRKYMNCRGPALAQLDASKSEFLSWFYHLMVPKARATQGQCITDFVQAIKTVGGAPSSTAQTAAAQARSLPGSGTAVARETARRELAQVKASMSQIRGWATLKSSSTRPPQGVVNAWNKLKKVQSSMEEALNSATVAQVHQLHRNAKRLSKVTADIAHSSTPSGMLGGDNSSFHYGLYYRNELDDIQSALHEITGVAQ